MNNFIKFNKRSITIHTSVHVHVHNTMCVQFQSEFWPPFKNVLAANETLQAIGTCSKYHWLITGYQLQTSTPLTLWWRNQYELDVFESLTLMYDLWHENMKYKVSILPIFLRYGHGYSGRHVHRQDTSYISLYIYPKFFCKVKYAPQNKSR